MTYIIGDSGIWVCELRVCLRLQESDHLGHEVEDDPETGFVFCVKGVKPNHIYGSPHSFTSSAHFMIAL